MAPPPPGGDVFVNPARRGGPGGVAVGNPKTKVADLAELAAVLPQDRGEGFQIWVVSLADFFVYRATSTTAPGSNVVRPNDIAGGNPGRWEREIEKASPGGVATLDGNGALVQPAVKAKVEGGTVLDFGPVADGQSLKRVGGQLVGYSPVTSEALVPGEPVTWEVDEEGVVALELPEAVPPELVYAVRLYRNGLRMTYRAEPATRDHYRIDGSTITLGAASKAGTEYQADVWKTP